MKSSLFFWLVSFFPISLALAIFEIWVEKHKTGPWGRTAFNNPFWEEKMDLHVPFLKYLSRYHGIVFLIILPILFVSSMLIWSNVLEYQMLPKHGHWYSDAASIGFLFTAIWFGNSGLEDFLYFLIQSITGWREPHALRKVVLEKDFEWFKDWLPPIFGLNIPGHWVFCPAVSVTLLAIHEQFVM